MEVREQKFLFGLLAACKKEILGFRAFRFLFETKKPKWKIATEVSGYSRVSGAQKNVTEHIIEDV